MATLNQGGILSLCKPSVNAENSLFCEQLFGTRVQQIWFLNGRWRKKPKKYIGIEICVYGVKC